jgi:DNA-directed RNA polymerase specialized sigma24 family protein
MDIDEAAAAVVAGSQAPKWGEALLVLCNFVQLQAQKARASDEEAEDIAQETLLKIVPKLQSGERPWDEGNHRAYLNKCARNGVIGLRRTSARQRLALSEEPMHVESIGDAVDELVESARELIGTAARFARGQRKPRYLEAFDKAWGELQALVYEERPLEEILAAQLAPKADRATYLKARNNAYKSHERTRLELLEAVNRLRSSGEFTATEADVATRALRVFVRCQRRASPSVTSEKGSQ